MLGSLSSPIDCSLDCPALLNLSGGSKGSTSASVKLRCRVKLSVGNEALAKESLRSLSLNWLGMLSDRKGVGTGGFGSWKLEDRRGVSPP